MLYDIHNHIGMDLGFYLRGWWPYAATAQDMIQHLDAHGIDRAIVFPFGLPSAFDPYAFAQRHKVELLHDRTPFDLENPMLLTELERLDPAHRLDALMMFDPTRRVSEQMRNLESLFARSGRGPVGLKVQATILESPIRGLLGVGRPIMEFADARRLPVLIHTSINRADTWSQAGDCLDVAEAFPGARFNLAHSLRFSVPHLNRARALPNVWVDCAAHLNHCEAARRDWPLVADKPTRLDADYHNPTAVLAALHDMLGDRMLWGSDNPFMSWCDDEFRLLYSYEKEVAALKALPPHVVHAIASKNPEAWLGIKA